MVADHLGVQVLPRITVEHDEIGYLPRDERAAAPFFPCEPGRGDAGGVERLLDREALLGDTTAGRSSIERRTPARIPASGSSSSIGASLPFTTTAPESSSDRNA